MLQLFGSSKRPGLAGHYSETFISSYCIEALSVALATVFTFVPFVLVTPIPTPIEGTEHLLLWTNRLCLLHRGNLQSHLHADEKARKSLGVAMSLHLGWGDAAGGRAPATVVNDNSVPTQHAYRFIIVILFPSQGHPCRDAVVLDVWTTASLTSLSTRIASCDFAFVATISAAFSECYFCVNNMPPSLLHCLSWTTKRG